VQAGHVTCPWHGWRFELATGKCTTVAEDSIVPCRVREVAGNLEVDLP
jgi:nitrite reductase/ring-hydroxylating ferredoxin subunit